MNLPSGLPEVISNGEPIARFLTSSSHYNAGGVKDRAFIPNPKDGKTSVRRQSAEPVEMLKDSATSFIGETRKVHGAGLLTAEDIRNVQLDLESEEPPPFHANIINWPWVGNDQELLKAERKKIAKVLASKAKKILF